LTLFFYFCYFVVFIFVWFVDISVCVTHSIALV